MSKILVTGSHGFVGKNLVKVLRKNKDNNIILFDKSKYPTTDIKKLSTLVKDCDYIFHLAAIINSTDSDIEKVNVLFTKNLAEAVLKTAPNCTFIFPSSFAVFRIPHLNEMVNEDFEKNPRNKYGETKLEAERILQDIFKKGNNRLVILRISNVYGPGAALNNGVISIFINKIKNRDELVINGKGDQTRDFVYIDDVVDALIKSTDNNLPKKIVVNICSGEEVSLKDLVGLISKISKISPKVKILGNDIEDGYWKGKNDLAKKFLKWKPKIKLTQGLKKTINDGE